MARPDESIVIKVEGHKIKKGREKGNIFMESPTGACFSIPYTVLKELTEKIESDEGVREKLGVEL